MNGAEYMATYTLSLVPEKYVERLPSAVAGTRSVEVIRLQGIVGRSRYAAEKNLKSVYNSQRCPIPGTIKTKGGIP